MDNINVTTDDVFISGSSTPALIRQPNILVNENVVQSEGLAATIQIGNVETLPPDDFCYVHNVGDEHNAILNFGIVRGYNGRDGVDGLDGLNGSDGFSPIATVTPIEGGATISVTDATETTTANIYDGTDGADGFSPIATVTQNTGSATISVTDANGTTTATVYDGISPTATVTPITGGAEIVITGASGTTSATVMDGTDGTDGADGFSPIATVTQNTGSATISITDQQGTTTATVYDGVDGTNGTDGYSPTATVTPTATGATISITDQQGTTTANITNGIDGTDGTDGITPSITATASVDNTTGTPEVTVTKSGTDVNPAFAFAFSHLKGNTGANGADAIVRTSTDSNNKTGIYYENGTLITYRRVTFTVAINTAWGSLYRGVTPDYYTLAPSNDDDFVSVPTVNVSPIASGSSSFFMGCWENQSTTQVGGRYAIPSGSISFLRPTTSNSVPIELDIIAIGKWK